MVLAIDFYDPKEKPFGPLSINYKYPLRIDGKEWRTASNYIYASVLKVPGYREQVRNSDTKDLKKLTDKLYTSEEHDLIKQSLDIAYQKKLEVDINSAATLINSGNIPIYYVSENKFLGTGGVNNDGENVLGKTLMQIRRSLQQRYRKEESRLLQLEQEENVYNLNAIYRSLLQLIHSNQSDLSEFINKTPQEIINMIGKENMERFGGPKDVIVSMFNKGLLDKDIEYFMENPTNIARLIRKNELGRLRKRLLKNRKFIVLDVYTDYILEKKFLGVSPDDYDKAKIQQYATISVVEKIKLAERIYDLYDSGYLDTISENLVRNINKKLSLLKIPSEKDVEQAENFKVFLGPKKGTEVKEEKEQKKETLDGAKYTELFGIKIMTLDTQDKKPKQVKEQQAIIVSPILMQGVNQIYTLSPLDLSVNFIVDNKVFPSVTHYITFKQFLRIYGGNVEKAYNKLLLEDKQTFKHADSLASDYDKENKLLYEQKFQESAEFVLSKKFEDKILQDILLTTGNAKLVYNDSKDSILGRTNNFIGKYLEKLRHEIKQDRSKRTDISVFTRDNINELLQSNSVLKLWIETKVNDICNIINIYYSYFYEQNPDEKNYKFVQSVLSKVFENCKSLLSLSSEVKAAVPAYFSELVQKLLGFNKEVDEDVAILEEKEEKEEGEKTVVKQKSNGKKYIRVNVSEKVVSLIWKYIVVIVYYIVNVLQQTTDIELVTVLTHIELLLGGKISEKDIGNIDSELEEKSMLEDKIQNAIINIIRITDKIGEDIEVEKGIDRYTIASIVSIIVKKDVKNIYLNYVNKILEKEELEELIAEEEIEDLKVLEKIEKELEDDLDIEEFAEELENALLEQMEEVEEAETEVKDEEDLEDQEIGYYDDEGLGEEINDEDGYRPRDITVNYLKEFNITEEPAVFRKILEVTVNFVEKYNMPKQNKYNRINFFE